MASIQFESAQHIPVEFTFASTIERAAAALIDGFIFLIYFIIVVSYVGEGIFFGTDINAMFLFVLFLKIPWIFYNPLCEYFFRGQTLGKYIMGIRVVGINGEAPTLKQSFTRWLFKGDFLWISVSVFILAWFYMGFASLFIIALSQKHQRIADIIANTICIKNKSRENYKLSQIIEISALENHTIIYPEVVQFSDEDMLLVKSIILRLRQKPTNEIVQLGIELCNKITLVLNIPPIEKDRMQFLEQLLKDYVVLTR